MKFSSEPPTAALFFCGEIETSRLNFRARSKISSEIKNFDRDQIFLIVGPSGFSQEPNAEPEPPEPSCQEPKPEPEPSSLLNCTETHKNPLLRGTAGTENRNRSNRYIPQTVTVTEPNRTGATLVFSGPEKGVITKGVCSLEESLESLESLNSLESLRNGPILLCLPQSGGSLTSLESLNSLESLEDGLF